MSGGAAPALRGMESVPLSETDAEPPPARTSRRRRSALREPVLVDRAELQDDAEGRVEIFTIEPELRGASLDGLPADSLLTDRQAGGRAHTALAFIDGWGGRVGLAVVLTVFLIVGLTLTR